MSYKVLATDSFAKDLKKLAKKYPSIKSDMLNLIGSLEINPLQGTPLGKDCYKIRLEISSKSKGKSGGSRVITQVHIKDEEVYLLTIYDKSDKDSLTDKDINELLKVL